jgi:hypothetical protein
MVYRTEDGGSSRQAVPGTSTHDHYAWAFGRFVTGSGRLHLLTGSLLVASGAEGGWRVVTDLSAFGRMSAAAFRESRGDWWIGGDALLRVKGADVEASELPGGSRIEDMGVIGSRVWCVGESGAFFLDEATEGTSVPAGRWGEVKIGVMRDR